MLENIVAHYYFTAIYNWEKMKHAAGKLQLRSIIQLSISVKLHLKQRESPASYFPGTDNRKRLQSHLLDGCCTAQLLILISSSGNINSVQYCCIHILMMGRRLHRKSHCRFSKPQGRLEPELWGAILLYKQYNIAPKLSSLIHVCIRFDKSTPAISACSLIAFPLHSQSFAAANMQLLILLSHNNSIVLSPEWNMLTPNCIIIQFPWCSPTEAMQAAAILKVGRNIPRTVYGAIYSKAFNHNVTGMRYFSRFAVCVTMRGISYFPYRWGHFISLYESRSEGRILSHRG